MAATPPPPSTLRTPPTPKYGAGYHSYDPYPTRHSARLASQRSGRDSHTTPPPASPQTRTQGQKLHDMGALSPPGSASSSPRKKPSGRKGILPPPLDKASSQSTTLFSTTSTAGMLPTPAKTPRKKAVGDPGTTARALFPTTSTPRTKKGKKYSGFSLESFHEDSSENQDKIEIFTDSRDRIPKMHEAEENPFYKKPDEERTSINATRSRTSKRRKVEELERSEEVQEALDRDDGMLYVFRGKRTFRKFHDDGDAEEESDEDDLGLLAARPDLIDDSINLHVRPLTRSSIKPRVLFPASKKLQTEDAPSTFTEEEATTDIEDQAEVDESEGANNVADADKSHITPPIKSTVTTPASPGPSSRSLRSRSARLHQEITPSGHETKKDKRISPFDGWMRKKQAPSPSAESNISKKREAEPTASTSGPVTKKAKGK